MKEPCETDAKKIARKHTWARFELPQEGRIAVLSGPENGDARHLRALGVDPSRLVCVDVNASSLAKAQSVEPRATYFRGDFLEALQVHPVSSFFLDETRICSAEAADYLAECASLVPAGAPFAAAYMYGRWAFAGKAPSWKVAHKHWVDFFTDECRRAFKARGLSFDCHTTIGYKGKSPMLVFVGNVSPPGVWRTPRVIKVQSGVTAEKQVRAWAVKSPQGADLFNLSPAKLAAWRAVATKEFQAKHAKRRVEPRDEAHARQLEYQRKYYAENKEAAREYKRKYHAENKEAARERNRKYNAENKEAAREYKRKYHADNKEAKREYNRKYYAENKEAALERKRKYYAENKEAARERNRKYYAENKEAAREHNRKYYAENREAKRERERKWYANNKEAKREYMSKYRATRIKRN